MEIPLTQGRVAQIDEADWPVVASYTWHAKRERGKWYAATSVRDPETGKLIGIRMHRLIMNAGPDDMVDHREIDRTLDNRRSNLRLCSNAENQQNSRSRRGTSRFKGVSWYARHGRWLVQFRWQGRSHFVGYFDDEEAAARAYDAAILPLAGEFARLNFPLAA